MISWIKGEIIDTWIQTKKFYVLVNCQGIGFEIQVLESDKKDFDKDTIILWVHQIKKEDSDLLFGFKDKGKRDFFRDLLQIKGIGPQIGMLLLNRYDLTQVFNAVRNKDKTIFNSVPGIGQKMTERLFLELKNKITITSKRTDDFNENPNNPDHNKEINDLIYDLNLALKSLSYSSRERKKAIDFVLKKVDQQKVSTQKILNDFTFENLLKDSLDFLAKNQ